MISKATEDTITTLLKEGLEKLGVKAEAFPSITTPAGIRKPDLLCSNAGIYPLEAKFSERDLIVAIAKIQNDYLKHHKVLGIKGGFAILYPEELTRPMPIEAVRDFAMKSRLKLVSMFPPEDARPFNVYEGSLPQIAKTIAEHVLTPPKYVEPSIDYIIKSLRESAMYIMNGLRHLASSQLEGFFGGKDVFKNILQYEEGKYPAEELKFAAAYLLVNQLLFYHVISRLRTDFPEIDPDAVLQPSDLNSYFRRVLDTNYRVVFSYDVASLIPSKFLDAVRTIINVIKGLSVEKVGGDLLGTIFHDLIPFDVRKNVAAFYTNVLAAELLASLSIDSSDVKVADFAVGSGGLLVAAYRRKKELLKAPFTQEVHRRFVEEELLGVDVMPFAANIAACHLALQSPHYFTNRVQIAVWDSTDLTPGKIIPSVAELKMVLTGQSFLDSYLETSREEKGVVSLTGEKPEEVRLETYDLVIMNPPFTRQERIPEEYKRILLDRFKEYKEYLHGQLGYYGYFILLADRFLNEGGRMALVLPATVLRVRSCGGLRKLWSQKYHIEHIITTYYRSAFSESVRFREILFVARKFSSKFSSTGVMKTTVTTLKRLPKTLTEARDLADKIKHSQSDYADDDVVIKIHDYSKLRENTSNWFKYIAVSDLSLVDLAEQLLASHTLIRFSDFLLRVNTKVTRGIETARGGKVQILTILRQERAIKKSDEWVVVEKVGDGIIARNRFTGKDIRIPLNAIRPALRRTSLVDKIDVTDELDYVLTNHFEGEEEYFRNSLSRSKPPNWEKWLKYVNGRLCHLAIVRRADLAAPGTCALAFYSSIPMVPPGISWAIKIEDEDAKILSLWFNSTIHILQLLLERKETRGSFLQLDEYVLEGLMVPDLTKLGSVERESLFDDFVAVKRARLPSILSQLKEKHPARRLIDETWLDILGYRGDKTSLLDKLYKTLAEEIELLKRLMTEGEEAELDCAD